MYPAPARHPAAAGPPPQPGQLKFTVAETCERIKEEFNFLQAQYHTLKLECEKLASEKTEMQRHYVMYYEMSYGLNVEMHKQFETLLKTSFPQARRSIAQDIPSAEHPTRRFARSVALRILFPEFGKAAAAAAAASSEVRAEPAPQASTPKGRAPRRGADGANSGSGSPQNPRRSRLALCPCPLLPLLSPPLSPPTLTPALALPLSAPAPEAEDSATTPTLPRAWTWAARTPKRSSLRRRGGDVR
ncbi:Uncharacterized protein GBIM_18557 [Gryllus bimaculatus]|nr:Uncharacterized protein GBIM_18557 [Gryllus bimaculatus]